MIFRIADTFTRSLGGLNSEEQKQVKITVFDLYANQANPAHPGRQFHKLDRAKDKKFWSVRVSRDIRIIVHLSEGSLLLCYVNHHDQAYHWAERRKIQAHPRTGAAQIIEVRESVQEIPVPKYRATEIIRRPLENVSREVLLDYGVPEEWISDLIAANEDSVLTIAERLPQEASEAILNLASGITPVPLTAAAPEIDPFNHPDAQRRFRVMENRDELERALDAPWEQWAVFLHPAQRSIVEGTYSGPVRVSGSAGTGKTIVALHRAVYLARSYPDSRILLTTFSSSLADALQEKLRILLHKQPRLGDQIEVQALDDYIVTLHQHLFGISELAERDEIKYLINKANRECQDSTFSEAFLLAEWTEVVDQRQILTWDGYKDTLRLGRRRRLSEAQRKTIWSVFDTVNHQLAESKKITPARIYSDLENRYKGTSRYPFDFVVVDEAQDISIPALRFLSSLTDPGTQSLFFAGDPGQRIFQQPFSWAALGVDIRGRSHILKVNYRTSHQIRIHADRFLDSTIRDADGNVEDRTGTVSVFNGAQPAVYRADDMADEIEHVSRWINDQLTNGAKPGEIGIVVRSEAQLPRAIEALRETGASYHILVKGCKIDNASITLTTMHFAKGLEFKAVVVMACDDDVIPSSERLEGVGDDSALEEVYVTERHLLYVACTRARDHLLITGVDPASEFLDDIQ